MDVELLITCSALHPKCVCIDDTYVSKPPDGSLVFALSRRLSDFEGGKQVSLKLF